MSAALRRKDEIFPTTSERADDNAFVGHVFACILAISELETREGGDLAQAIGLRRAELDALAQRWPLRPAPSRAAARASERVVFDDEAEQLLQLLQMHRVDDSQESFWLARMMTARAMRPNHLWQDLGLNDRAELNRLMRCVFPTLAARNVANMKWKKFFYRMLCEMEGFTLCTAPSCQQCDDFDRCFGAEDGESLLARIRRENTTEAVSHL